MMTNDIVVKEIIEREELRRQALLEGDVNALESLLSDRLVFAHATAKYEDKSSLLAKMGEGTIIYDSLTISGQRVIPLGETALLVSRLTAAVRVGGQQKSIDNWTLSAWTKEEGEWKLVAYQPTKIPD